MNNSSLGIFIQIGFLWIVIYFGQTAPTIVTDDDSTIDDRIPSDVPIVRQINKFNDDGTYTYGYEAADGSFKIETRDVLGNVKGMFGFIDESGELKRVSYTANNSTGYRSRHSSTASRNPPTVSDSYTTVRSSSSSASAAADDIVTNHRSSTTRKPILLLKNNPTTVSPGQSTIGSKSPVIQHIPKKILQELEDLTSTTTGTGLSITSTTTTATTDIAASSSTSDFDRYVNSEKKITTNDDVVGESSLQRTTSTTTTASPLRKIVVSRRPIEEKDISKGKGGNNLRRQLGRGFEARTGDTSHVYGGENNGKYSSTNVPSHLSALMSELRPIQAPRPAYIVPAPHEFAPSSPVEEYPPDSELSASPHDVTDYPLTTTEVPTDQQRRLKYAARTRPLKPTGTPIFEESAQYLVGADEPVSGGGYRQIHLQPVASIPIPLNSAYTSPPPPLPPHNPQLEPYALPIPSALRDELMAIVYQYLQARLNNIQNPYYNNVSPIPGRFPYYPGITPTGNLFLPQQANYPAYGQFNQFPLPYGNYLPQTSSYYPFFNPNVPASPLLSPYPVPSSVPYVANPNIQASSRRPNTIRNTNHNKVQSIRSPAPADDVDLLQMLLTSPTKIPIHRLKYGETDDSKSTTSSTYRLTQPVRNVQIISTESGSYRPTSASSGTEPTE